MDSLQEMYVFFEVYALPRLTNEEQESLGRLTRNEIKLVIKCLRQKQDMNLIGPTAELAQTLKEEPMPKWFSFFKSVPKSREYYICLL